MKTETPDPFPNIPNYELATLLGTGGMGSVYRGFDQNDNEVAVKIMPASDPQSPLFHTQTERLTKLTHPNIPTLLDYGVADNNFYLVTPYLEGIALSQILRDNPNGIPVKDCLHIFLPVARALAQAHLRGITHFGLQPGNILLSPAPNTSEPYHVWVSDIGIDALASAIAANPDSRRANIPAYTAPEQWQQTDFDSRVDLYSLGVMIYESLTGQHPFPIRSAFDVAKFRQTGQLVSLRAHVRQVPILLDVLVKKLLSGNPERRARSSEAVVADLERILQMEIINQPVNQSAIQLQVDSLLAAVAASRRDTGSLSEPQQIGIRVLYYDQWDGKTYLLEDNKPLIVGRLLTADITLVSAERFVSKAHCEITRKNGKVWVRDLGSTNGAILGDGKLDANQVTQWQSDTYLRLGPFTLMWGNDFDQDMSTLVENAGQLAATKGAIRLSLHCPNAYPQRVEIGLEGHTPLRLGRAIDCDMVLNHPHISKVHCEVAMTNKGVQITDLGSTNGSIMQGKRLPPNQPTTWLASVPLIIGPFTISLESTSP